MNGEIIVKMELRPCMVCGKKAFFHAWEHRQEIVPPSNLRGGHQGGQTSAILGLVEFEGGMMGRVYPDKIKFLDDPFKGIAWPEEVEHE